MSLESIDRKCKDAFFQLVSEYGRDHIGRYNVSEDEIKLAINRQRSTPEMWDKVTNFFESKGYIVDKTNSGILLQLETTQMASSPSDQLQLANALKLFRARAILHDDVDNM